MVQCSKFCELCHRNTLHARPSFSAGWGILLTLLTAGLFIPLWMLLGLNNMSRPMVCQTCGQNRGGLGFAGLLALAGAGMVVYLVVASG